MPKIQHDMSHFHNNMHTSVTRETTTHKNNYSSVKTTPLHKQGGGKLTKEPPLATSSRTKREEEWLFGSYQHIPRSCPLTE